MALTETDIKKIARLSRLGLSAEEITHYTAELNAILSWIEQLQAVDTTGIAPLSSVANQSLPMRDDVVSDGGIQADILANAKDAKYGCFSVPKVIE